MTRKTELAGKIAVITGAGSGIGAATARLLAARGAKVHLADLNADAAEAVARHIRQAGGTAEAHAVDVADPAAVEALAKAVYDADGRVDILHNNAGIAHAGNIEATTIEDWQQVIGVNLLGVAYGIQAFVPRMLTQGRPASIVNTASLAGLVPAALMAPYCASKYGVVGMTEALNAELSGQGIHVSAVCPGVIDTAIARTCITRGRMETLQGQVTATYARRGTPPEAVAEAVLHAIRTRKMIITVPRKEALPGVLLHRISPRLAQPVARYFIKYASRG
jgi:NAD(P)-dependent dehydrogenase (short-subunit alcohol dehydrogenase family)